MPRALLLFALLLLPLAVQGPPSAGAEKASPPIDRPRVAFTRLIAHWAEYGDDDYLKFVDDARPQVCQVGFYGGHFYSLAHTPQYNGYPAHFPVRGLAACGDWFAKRNADIHKR